MSNQHFWNNGFPPKFSSGRHKPRSRLKDWHSIDYDDELHTEMSCYHHGAFANHSSLSNIQLAVHQTVNNNGSNLQEDFLSLKHRTGSTSTPFIPRAFSTCIRHNNLSHFKCLSNLPKNIVSNKVLIEEEIVTKLCLDSKLIDSILSPAEKTAGNETLDIASGIKVKKEQDGSRTNSSLNAELKIDIKTESQLSSVKETQILNSIPENKISISQDLKMPVKSEDSGFLSCDSCTIYSRDFSTLGHDKCELSELTSIDCDLCTEPLPRRSLLFDSEEDSMDIIASDNSKVTEKLDKATKRDECNLDQFEAYRDDVESTVEHTDFLSNLKELKIPLCEDTSSESNILNSDSTKTRNDNFMLSANERVIDDDQHEKDSPDFTKIIDEHTVKVKLFQEYDSKLVAKDSRNFSPFSDISSHCYDNITSTSIDSAYESNSSLFTASCNISTYNSIKKSEKYIQNFDNIHKKKGTSLATSRADSIPESWDNCKNAKFLKQLYMNCSQVIGPKIGLKYLDVVSWLQKRNISPALTKLFRFLEDKDLITFTKVCKGWKLALLEDSKAKQRRIKYLKSRRNPLNKENILKSPQKNQERLVTGVKEGPLSTLQLRATLPTKSPVKDPNGRVPLTRHQLFVKAASVLQNDESLRKCPFCSSPAKVEEAQERAICENKRCGYDYCIKCRKPFHSSKPCVINNGNKNAKTQGCVGSKKSKKNLKRL